MNPDPPVFLMNAEKPLNFEAGWRSELSLTRNADSAPPPCVRKKEIPISSSIHRRTSVPCASARAPRPQRALGRQAASQKPSTPHPTSTPNGQSPPPKHRHLKMSQSQLNLAPFESTLPVTLHLGGATQLTPLARHRGLSCWVAAAEDPLSRVPRWVLIACPSLLDSLLWEALSAEAFTKSARGGKSGLERPKGKFLSGLS